MALLAESLKADGCCVDQRTQLGREGQLPLISVRVEGVGEAAEIVYRWAAYQDVADKSDSKLASEGEVEVRVQAASITGCKALRASNDPSKTRVVLHLREKPHVSVQIKVSSGPKETLGVDALPTILREKLMLATEHSFVFCAPCHAVRLGLSPVCMFAPAQLATRRKVLSVYRRRHHTQITTLKKPSCSTLSSALDKILKPKRSTPVQSSTGYVVQRHVSLEKWNDLSKSMDRVCSLKPGTFVTASKKPEERLGALYQLVTVRGSKLMGWLKLQQGADHGEQSGL
eukprot:TRINITY_DN60661_c0_g1_i1.p1 TRINITY_DN60661_c0_g1~~TRINITY_DN60661_c0_g1_i1.p1  ORF type:complete len:286 (+),score=41.57 TRINITY_DN60661_c0_g1_i1:80-937(+)